MPIHSKWVGTRQLAHLDEVASEKTHQERELPLNRPSEEMTADLDPDRRLGLALVTVPNALYRWTQRLHARALPKGAIAYNLAIPSSLARRHFAVRFLRKEDFAQLFALTHQLEQARETIQSELSGRYARALTMLQNSRDMLPQQAAGALGEPCSNCKCSEGELGPLPGRR